MDEDQYEIEVLPATVEPDAGRDLVVHADLERLRREVAAPPIVREAGPGAEYAYADFFKAKISNPNTRKAYKRAVDRFLGWCQVRGLATPPGHVVPRRRLRRAPPARQGRPSPVGPQQEAAPGRPAPLLRQPADVPRGRHQPRLQRPRPEVLRPRGQDARLRRSPGPHAPGLDRERRRRRDPRQDPAHDPRLHRRPGRCRGQAADDGLLHRRPVLVVPLRRERRQAPPGPGAARPPDPDGDSTSRRPGSRAGPTRPPCSARPRRGSGS